ncbi:single-stranded DNA-binding protein [Streptococcus canis]|uniref:Single-stranded DNA-binding protein n=1 Tax=Streptococcus canis FSL Z3-227 TaxID=482234 RepID=A0AAV3FUT5_STRCB|nr:single-stranded DNA-binding protein [Streptococcus canis]EIQ82694.1 single-strand binding protein ssB [Streptococcus canis FSL Z3-227]
MNNANLIGRLTRKPELYQTPDGKSYTRFTLAINRKKKSGGSADVADFIPCIIWGKSAENLCEWSDKGTLLSVEGDIRTRNVEKDGVKFLAVEVWASYFQILNQPQK